MAHNPHRPRSTSVIQRSRRQLRRTGAHTTVWRKIAPAELFVASFVALIAAGVLAFRFMPGLYQNDSLGWTDSIFTATSAVCVTGLIVVDTATHFTFLGQLVILVLIQLGGLGMLVLTSVIISAIGGRPSIGSESMAASTSHVLPQVSASKLILDVVRFTFFFEAIGTILLYVTWAPKLGWREAVWPSVFHSISAFCNAGFSTNTASLIPFQDSPTTIFIISALVISGGIGFITMEEIYQVYLLRNRAIKRISIHSKLVLATSGLLLVGAWPAFAIFEWNGVLAEMPVLGKLTNSFFLSVTPRTAGFNTIDYAQASDSTNFLTIILMMVGGSPGSTAGGLKTTTIALLGLLAWSRLRSNPTCTFANRSIPEATIQRAIGLFVIGIGVVVLGVLAIATVGDFYGTEQPFLVRMFEVVSAFNTVGLSMGITGDLVSPSKWILIGLMFAGRTGPLAIAAALVVRLSTGGRYRLAYEDVVVG
jgi:trk system potassium uptake protein TrkH